MDYTFTRTELEAMRAHLQGQVIVQDDSLRRAFVRMSHALEDARTGYPATIKREG